MIEKLNPFRKQYFKYIVFVSLLLYVGVLPSCDFFGGSAEYSFGFPIEYFRLDGGGDRLSPIILLNFFIDLILIGGLAYLIRKAEKKTDLFQRLKIPRIYLTVFLIWYTLAIFVAIYFAFSEPSVKTSNLQALFTTIIILPLTIPLLINMYLQMLIFYQSSDSVFAPRVAIVLLLGMVYAVGYVHQLIYNSVTGKNKPKQLSVASKKMNYSVLDQDNFKAKSVGDADLNLKYSSQSSTHAANTKVVLLIVMSIAYLVTVILMFSQLWFYAAGLAVLLSSFLHVLIALAWVNHNDSKVRSMNKLWAVACLFIVLHTIFVPWSAYFVTDYELVIYSGALIGFISTIVVFIPSSIFGRHYILKKIGIKK